MFISRRVTALEPGVNIHGYLFAEHGVGEEARWLVRIARQAGLDFAALPYTETFSRQAVPFTDLGTEETVYDVNLICVNADTIPKFVRHVGPELLEGRYNIAMWAWEVEDLPEWMAESAGYLDEIWACSSFAADAIARSVSCPVLALPLPITPLCPARSRRQDLGLSESFTFLFCFDFNSIFERKNALALIAAFKRAFAPGDGAQLLIKTINGKDFPHQLERLDAAALDRPDVKVVDGYLETSEQQVLMSACDVYVSLHRSEGYGFTMAEAMALGTPVIATGYSGNMDFMTEENSYPVPYRLVSIPPGCDPYPETSRWAEPDVDSAASLMRRVFEHPEEARAKAEQARRDVEQKHTPQAKADVVIERLNEVRQTIEARKPGILRSTLEKLHPKTYATARFDPTAGDHDPRHHRHERHRAFGSLKSLIASSLVKFSRDKLVPELACGSLDGAEPDEDGGISVWGWAIDPRTDRPARSVVLMLNEVQAPVQIAVVDERPDVASYADNPDLGTSGWSFYVPPRMVDGDDVVIEAYALLGDGRFGRLSGPGSGRVAVTAR